MTTYLVTGATGLIGRHFMAELLRRDDVDAVHVLVRESSRERLARLAGTWSRPDVVHPLLGDIAEERLGLLDEEIAELTGTIDHVVHLAALYDLTADDERNAAANIDGTRHVLEVAAAVHARGIHHVSSVAVAGDYQGTFTEDMFDAGQRLTNPYHRTKFESEKLVREQLDVPWRVYRPAVVVGHSHTGAMDKNDGPYVFFPAFARLAALPSLPLALPAIGSTNIVPVDYVAAALAHLVNEPGLDGRSFHLVNPQPQTFTEVYNAFARAAGAPVASLQLPAPVSDPLLGLVRLTEWVPGAAIARDAVLNRLGIPPVMLSVLTFPTVFDSAATRQALAGTGIDVPPLADYANVLWRYWREHLDPYRARRSAGRGPLDGRRVVITGASSGIGRATALKVAGEGGIPLLVARREHELEDLRAEIRAEGGDAYAYPCDLTDGDAVEKTVAQMLVEHPAVDMLVNNAGRSIRRSVRLSYDRFHDYERAMAINYFGSVRLLLALLPHMSERKFGHVVNVSSIGVQGIAPRFSAYVASKAALDYFAKIAATEFESDGITFTTVHMPLVRTPMIRPTKIYDAFPTKSPEQAADMIMHALRERPKHIGTAQGQIMSVAYTLAPGLVDVIAHEAYRIFPDSTAAGGSGAVRLGKGERGLTKVANAFVKLTRGFHW